MNKILILLLNSLLVNCISHAQEIFSYVEQMPRPKTNVNEFISANLRYPADAKEQGIQGKVTVKFIVDSTGNILNPMVPRSVHPSLDSECIRVIALMPKWEPGKQNGKLVNVYSTIPINFEINDTLAMQSDKTTADTLFTLPRTGFSLEDYFFWKLRYPEKLMLKQIGGNINFEFTIDTSGSAINFKELKSTDTSITNEVKRVLGNMPKWIPGSANGLSVCMTLNQEITYTVSRKGDLSRRNGGVEYGIKCDRKWTTPKFVRYEISCSK